MYDASGVRRQAGRQAQILKPKLWSILVNEIIPVILKDREIALKELLGHTPVEVFGGLVLGILIAYIQYFYVYNGVI